MKRGSMILLVTAVLFSGAGFKASGHNRGASILSIFAVGDFLPHVPTLLDVKEELGHIQETRIANNRVYTYRVSQAGWLVFHLNDALEDRYTVIEEVVYTSFPPSAANLNQVIGRDLVSKKLLGIGLGDSLSTVMKRNLNFKKRKIEIFGRKMFVYECNPKKNEDDLFYRYFIVNNKVQAFSIGVTE